MASACVTGYPTIHNEATPVSSGAAQANRPRQLRRAARRPRRPATIGGAASPLGPLRMRRQAGSTIVVLARLT